MSPAMIKYPLLSTPASCTSSKAGVTTLDVKDRCIHRLAAKAYLDGNYCAAELSVSVAYLYESEATALQQRA